MRVSRKPFVFVCVCVRPLFNWSCSRTLVTLMLTTPESQQTHKNLLLFNRAGLGFFRNRFRCVGHFLKNKTNEIKNQLCASPVCVQALVYEIGFLVCFAIGVVYIVLMPLVGILLACCRCCGNCGGKMQQKQKSSTSCRRRALYWGTFVTTVIIL